MRLTGFASKFISTTLGTSILLPGGLKNKAIFLKALKQMDTSKLSLPITHQDKEIFCSDRSTPGRILRLSSPAQ